MANPSTAYDSTSNTTEVYKYKASGFYVYGSNKYSIDFMNFKSIVIDHDYEINNMPLLYIILNIDAKLADAIVTNQKTGVFILSIQKCIDNSDMPDLWEDCFNDTFLYYLSEDINKKDERDYEASNTGREDMYREVTIGLLSQKLVNNNKTVANGIINCSDMSSAVSYVIGKSLPLVMEPFKNNQPLKRVVLPPVSSVAKAVAYLNSIKVFYDSKYRYYMDLDAIYLLSSSGKAVPRKGNKGNSVHIALQNDYDKASKVQGMTFNKQGSFYAIDVSGVDAEVENYNFATNSYSKLQYTDTDGKSNTITTANLDKQSSLANKTVNVRVPNGNIGLVTNAEKNTDIYLAINKTDLDTTVLTLNKEYVLNAENVYTGLGYSGTYILRRKRELYFRGAGSDDKFTINVMLYLEKAYSEDGDNRKSI